MKSFTTVVLAAAALTSAQFTTNPDGSITCATPNAVYCAGDSLTTNIIIRCVGTVGQPGNCNDNLDGDFPQGVSFSPCWSSGVNSGVAACSKNCIVYGGSGNYNGSFTLPNCTPTATPSSSVSSSSVTSSSSVSTAAAPTTPVTYTTTVTVPCTSGTPTYTSPSVSLTTGPVTSSSAPAPVVNGTITAPSSPKTTGPVPFTGAAAANQAGSLLVAAGLLVAYFL